MSKITLPARNLDSKKPMPVFRSAELPDEYKNPSVNRAVLPLPTENEKESGHRPQQKKDMKVTSVQEVEQSHLESLYPGEFEMPKELIQVQPFRLSAQLPDYDMDSDDEMFLEKLNEKMEVSALQFEEMMDRLEKGSAFQPCTFQQAKLLLKEDDDVITEVFAYWSQKRATCESGSLTPKVKQEKRDGSSTNDPYVAFRKRTKTIQTRYARKNNEESYMKMVTLRRQMSRAATILEMVKKREKTKRELLHTTLEAIEKRNLLAELDTDAEARANSNQGHLEMKEYKEPEKIEVIESKKAPEIPPSSFHPIPNSNLPWKSPSEGGLGNQRVRYHPTLLNMPQPFVKLVRCHVKPGERVLVKRSHTDQNIWQIVESKPQH